MAEQPNINIFEGPIPGQSMTASPDSKMPWDGPPEFAGLQEASQDLFLSFSINWSWVGTLSFIFCTFL